MEKMCNCADKELEEFINCSSCSMSHHRMETQQNKCKFGSDGLCCKLCANGPCKITAKSPLGVCGANGDTIVARNFLRSVSAGAGCYLHVAENTALNLKSMAEKRETLKGKAALERLCTLFDIQGENEFEKAGALAELVLSDLYKRRDDKMDLTGRLGYKPRTAKWESLGILPGGAKSEVFDALVKTSTNLNSDPVDMLMHALRLGVATGIHGLIMVNLLNDIMLGEPVIRQAEVGFKVVDEDYINIMITGHQHSTFSHLQEKLIADESKQRAKSAGAKGFKIVGSTCVGQDFQLRGEHYQEVFSGHVGNNFTSEALIATGAIDLILSEFNCTLPGIEAVAEEKQVKTICLDDVARMPGADFIQFSPGKTAEISEQIINAALESYQNRRSEITINIPKNHGHDDVITGVSEESLKSFLGDSWQPLIDLIASGQIKGVAAVVGCSNLVAGGHDVFTVELTKELIKRDILVLSAGCSSGGLENAGLMSPGAASLAGHSLSRVCGSLGIPPVLNFGPCLAIGRLELVAQELAAALGIDIPQLPLVLSAPQWLEEQALADGAFGLALGLPLHLAKPPFIEGSPLVTAVLTEKLEELTGGRMILEDDVEKTAHILDEIIENRREALGLTIPTRTDQEQESTAGEDVA